MQDLKQLVSSEIGIVSDDEIISALPVATAKLNRIIRREGDADGKRFEASYLAQLIAEYISVARFADEIEKINKKRRAAKKASAPKHISILA